MGSPEKPLDVELGDMSDETKQLNPDVKTEGGSKDDGQSEERFTGLTKEELMKVSSEPKWVRARWALFIIFWLIWIGMLVGAILIVVKAPRCIPEPEQQWYQDTVVYEVDPEQFAGGFKAMEGHLDYIKDIKAETILLTGTSDMADPGMVLGLESDLMSLIDAVHKKEMKIMVDLKVASVSTSNPHFNASSNPSCANDTTGTDCEFFVWSKSVGATESGISWNLDGTRNEYFKAADNANLYPLINYDNANAQAYLSEVFTTWFNRDIDGVQISDMNLIQSTNSANFVKDIWDSNFQGNTSKALFVYSSGSASLFSAPAANDTNTSPNPVVVDGKVQSHVGHAGAGKMIQTDVVTWRSSSKNVGGNTASPLGLALSAERALNYSAGLNLLAMALPGVPVIRSGDEAGLTTPVFNWTEKGQPFGAESDVLTMVKDMAEKKVKGIQSMQSIRYDTRNNDTVFRFIDTTTDDVVVFFRKWATKTAVMVVSNMSPNDHQVNIVNAQGLQCKGSPCKQAKVEVASISVKDGIVDLEKLNVPSGSTFVLAGKS